MYVTSVTLLLSVYLITYMPKYISGYSPTDVSVNCSRLLSAFVPEEKRNTTTGVMLCLPPHGKCYMIARSPMVHKKAVEYCESIGATIVKPESDEESEMLAGLANGTFHLPATRISESDYYDFPEDMPVYANWICFRELYHGLCLAASTKKGLWRPLDCHSPVTTICQF